MYSFYNFFFLFSNFQNILQKSQYIDHSIHNIKNWAQMLRKRKFFYKIIKRKKFLNNLKPRLNIYVSFNDVYLFIL